MMSVFNGLGSIDTYRICDVERVRKLEKNCSVIEIQDGHQNYNFLLPYVSKSIFYIRNHIAGTVTNDIG